MCAPDRAATQEETVILSDGSASYDKELKGWVSAGFGFVAVEGGDGPEHTGGGSIHEHQGPVDLGDFGGAVQQLTNNVSELVLQYPRVMGYPVTYLGTEKPLIHSRAPLGAYRA